MATYQSKIGRLPYSLRSELNSRLRDGHSQSEVLAWLNAHPVAQQIQRDCDAKPINATNMSDWLKTGYVDWERDQTKTEQLARLAELSSAIVEQTGGDPTAVGARILSGRLLDILSSDAYGDDDLKDIIASMCNLRKTELDQRKLELMQQQTDLKDRTVSLDEQKFRRDTCALFIKWAQDQAALAIVEDGDLDSDAKTDALGRLLFGGNWEPNAQ